MLVKDFPDVGRDAFYIVVVLVRLVKKVIGERHRHALLHQLHDHVLRGADQIVLVPQREHIVEVLVGAEGRVFHLHIDAVGLLVPLLKVLHHGVLTDDVAALQLNGLLFVPVPQVDVLLPVADSENDGLAALFRCQGFHGHGGRHARRSHHRCTCAAQKGSRFTYLHGALLPPAWP